MEFRPCVDIHNGKVKQIVGGSLTDVNDVALENYVSEVDGDYYGKLYKKYGLKGGHIILLNHKDSQYYEATKQQAIKTLKSYDKGFQIGGGIDCSNAKEYIENGADKVIVTSYVFKDGKINYQNLKEIVAIVGKENLVLDLSVRKKDSNYYVVTDRWQKFTDEILNHKLLDELEKYCSEFLIHAVDVEGKADGIEENVVKLLSEWGKIPTTYAGGISSYDDIRLIKKIGKNKINITIGSALDIFGGKLKIKEVLDICKD
ncbi:phosphoribosylformimino-5-aminoimidazole carboxamide ribotide isomerase [Lachnobacterium bovis]|uniref:1-(5-phosphoribosyl)-5-[(5-phosphoribosylamino)methylideneamino] imidazole-4-carboxamide isomerase n=1 Tax=Lachnobacterium bovis TaxID=140626 RepID=A0A1H9RYX6_9FIRM|nr:phosphoribosylformimino-5-aminoimidazole carboxamide ribotide isomerase [Lachnobacterium bovis]SER77961.1 1-(5-phosphoribosyl)-5-[(5-phosphoribosylamino)methylideneamino] imidazole-4-carboxamide isomerase [Lachnobacterium bovis]